MTVMYSLTLRPAVVAAEQPRLAGTSNSGRLGFDAECRGYAELQAGRPPPPPPRAQTRRNRCRSRVPPRTHSRARLLLSNAPPSSCYVAVVRAQASDPRCARS